MMDETHFTIKGENGQDHVYEILYTFEDDYHICKYIVFTDHSLNDEGQINIFANRYEIKDGQYVLYELQDAKEWQMVEDTLEALDSFEEAAEDENIQDNGEDVNVVSMFKYGNSGKRYAVITNESDEGLSFQVLEVTKLDENQEPAEFAPVSKEEMKELESPVSEIIDELAEKMDL